MPAEDMTFQELAEENRQLRKTNDHFRELLEWQEQDLAAARAALEPFAEAGKLTLDPMNMTNGKPLPTFPDSEFIVAITFGDGEEMRLTLGHLRAAAEAMKGAKPSDPDGEDEAIEAGDFA